MDNNQRQYDTASEFIVLILFLVTILVTLSRLLEYLGSRGKNDMASFYILYAVMTTFVTGLLSLIVALIRFKKIRVVFRILGFCSILFFVGTLLYLTTI